MSISQIQRVLLYCTVINYGLLITWVLLVAGLRAPWYRWQAKLFQLSTEQASFLNWAGIARYKMSIVMFNLVPYLALRLVLGRS